MKRIGEWVTCQHQELTVDIIANAACASSISSTPTQRPVSASVRPTAISLILQLHRGLYQ